MNSAAALMPPIGAGDSADGGHIDPRLVEEADPIARLALPVSGISALLDPLRAVGAMGAVQMFPDISPSDLTIGAEASMSSAAELPAGDRLLGDAGHALGRFEQGMPEPPSAAAWTDPAVIGGFTPGDPAASGLLHVSNLAAERSVPAFDEATRAGENSSIIAPVEFVGETGLTGPAEQSHVPRVAPNSAVSAISAANAGARDGGEGSDPTSAHEESQISARSFVTAVPDFSLERGNIGPIPAGAAYRSGQTAGFDGDNGLMASVPDFQSPAMPELALGSAPMPGHDSGEDPAATLADFGPPLIPGFDPAGGDARAAPGSYVLPAMPGRDDSRDLVRTSPVSVLPSIPDFDPPAGLIPIPPAVPQPPTAGLGSGMERSARLPGSPPAPSAGAGLEFLGNARGPGEPMDPFESAVAPIAGAIRDGSGEPAAIAAHTTGSGEPGEEPWAPPGSDREPRGSNLWPSAIRSISDLNSRLAPVSTPVRGGSAPDLPNFGAPGRFTDHVPRIAGFGPRPGDSPELALDADSEYSAGMPVGAGAPAVDRPAVGTQGDGGGPVFGPVRRTTSRDTGEKPRRRADADWDRAAPDLSSLLGPSISAIPDGTAEGQAAPGGPPVDDHGFTPLATRFPPSPELWSTEAAGTSGIGSTEPGPTPEGAAVYPGVETRRPAARGAGDGQRFQGRIQQLQGVSRMHKMALNQRGMGSAMTEHFERTPGGPNHGPVSPNPGQFYTRAGDTS